MLHINSLEEAEEYLFFVVWTFILIRSTLMDQSWSYRHIKKYIIRKVNINNLCDDFSTLDTEKSPLMEGAF